MKEAAVAVLDVGKTNKKLCLYSRSFESIAEERTVIETRDDDGLEVENTEALLHWFRDAMKKLSAKADVKAIAVTAHGATAAVLDEDGNLAHPVVSYTAERGAAVQEEFYERYGSREELHRATCAPDLRFVNVAKIMYFLMTRRPEAWKHVRHAMFYDTYLAFELTGEMGLETTYLGNHTYLWDYQKDDWSHVAKDMGLDGMFPWPPHKPWERLGTVRADIAAECGLDPNCPVTMGIHDSNANLLPYLSQNYSDFMLNSTGTWCVLMRPSESKTLNEEEIQKHVFFNMDALGNPVRTVIFPAGMEYDAFRAFTDEPDDTTAEDVRRVIAEKNLFVVPGVIPEASAFPGAAPRVVRGGTVWTLDQLRTAGGTPMTQLGRDYNAALNISLAFATRVSLEACGVEKGTRVFIEGGFAKNTAYCQLLATLCPEQTIALTKIKEGTSFGGSLTGWMLAEGLSLEEIGKEFDIEAEEIEPQNLGNLSEYENAFNVLLRS
jgi:sugar (pentulose or hexulose) kinase